MAKAKEEVLAYKFWTGFNKFACKGNLILGPDWYKAVISFFLIVLPGALYIAVPGMYFIREQSNPTCIILGIILMILSWSFLITAALVDPGYLPSQKVDQISIGPEGAPLAVKLPNHNDRDNFDFNIRGHFVRMKYCGSCCVFRPPRCSHWVEWNVCVERFDHHCPWVGNCVAKRNYKYFMAFLFFTAWLCLHIMISCWAHLAEVSNDDGFARALEESIPSTLLIFYSFGFFGFTGGMFGFHLYLTISGQTTYEKLKGTWASYNPFQLPTCWKNIFWKLCPPKFPKFFDPQMRTEIEPSEVVENPRKYALISAKPKELVEEEIADVEEIVLQNKD